jgi:HD-like signal output (HDOD) protein
MNSEIQKLDALLAQVRNLPPLSNGVSQLLALNANDPALTEKVKEIVQADPAIAAQILKVANSAAFTGQQVVDTVERAIMRVGVRMVTGAIAQTQMSKAFDPSSEVMGAIWFMNLLSADFAKALAERCPAAGVEPDTAYTYGLLHDVGRLVMAAMLGPKMMELLDEAPPLRTDLVRRERALYGYDHMTAGRLLGNRWRLPAEMTLVIAAHHLPPAERQGCPPSVVRMIDFLALVDEVVHLAVTRAENLEDVAAALTTSLAAPELRAVCEQWKIDEAAILGALKTALEEADRQRRMLGVKKHDPATK